MNTMSTSAIDKVSRKASVKSTSEPAPDTIPPLESGDRLTRAEFELRYQAHPHIKKAELIEGVVYVPSPVSLKHAEIHGNVITLLGVYRSSTPGIRLADNVTIRLDLDNEVQPDATMWIDETWGGQSSETEDGYVAGAPELVAEVAVSSAAYDLHDKLKVYRRSEVQEYLVVLVHEQKVLWYALEEGEYRPLMTGEGGILRSRVFPGLHFHPEMFWNGDLAGLLRVLQEGVKTPEHAEFAARLEAVRAERS